MKQNRKKKINNVLLGVIVVSLVGFLVFVIDKVNKNDENGQNNAFNSINNTKLSPTQKLEEEIKILTTKADYKEQTIKFSLPNGWDYGFEVDDNSMDGVKFEIYNIYKGNNYIKLVKPAASGRAYCPSPTEASYKKLSNINLGKIIMREEPTSHLLLSVCTGESVDSDLYDETKAGFISYHLTKNWDNSTLEEMDSIVESIKYK